jgi:hypothetical protein
MNLKFLGLCLLLMSATSVAATVGEMAPDFEVTTQNGDGGVLEYLVLLLRKTDSQVY